MTRFLPFRALLTFFALLPAVAFLLASNVAWAKFVPPPAPAPGAHCVTMVGWLAPSDVKKVDEAAETVRMQTGFVIDVLLATTDEPIDDVANATFQAWKPGDPTKDNGILLVIQPNFPRGERKVRLQVGKGVQDRMSPAKAREIMHDIVGPLINNTDQVRTAVASAVLEISKTVGGDLTPPVVDAGSAALAPALAPALAASPPPESGVGQSLAVVIGVFLAVILAYVAFQWLRSRSKESRSR